VKQNSAVSYTVNNKTLHKPGRGVVPNEVRDIGVGEIRNLDKRRVEIWIKGEFGHRFNFRMNALLLSAKDLLISLLSLFSP
jgi:hypothetical protein